ncbi:MULTISPECIES: hypothetical protein [Sphingomonas]|uniref:Uncharacterized protein n=1 Tax=Sphingomonas molluscorum TaxID=418184 RepID=A0ABU8Q7L1_9SPHN|nr:hypothetical protein [Sphingomonas sp. JUb134]MBM7407069.1 hypothetical protein [Sphingomonas sp. JUb134]
MGIPRDALQRIVNAGHPDSALVGMPVSLVREILAILPVDRVRHVVDANPPAQAAGAAA